MEITKFNIFWDESSKSSFTDDYLFTEVLRKEHRIIPEAIGTPKTARKQNKTLIKPFVLNKFETAYLYEMNVVDFKVIEHEMHFKECYDGLKNTTEYKIYIELKSKHFFVTSGTKYGADFLVYRDDPNFIHSEFLVFVRENSKDISVKELISGERISLSHKKKFLIGTILEDGEAKFYNFDWINI